MTLHAHTNSSARSLNISTADGDVRYVPGEQGANDFSAMAHESRYYWLAQHVDLTGKSVCDFGCGSGYGAGFLSTKAGRTLGIDISRTAIEYAERTYSAATFMAHDLTDPGVVDVVKERFDVIVSFDVIEHIEKYWSFVHNIGQLLKEGGVAFIGCPNRWATFDFNYGFFRVSCGLRVRYRATPAREVRDGQQRVVPAFAWTR